MSKMMSEQTTERIRLAALDLFVANGIGQTTTEHIANSAEVGVATVYRRWPDKFAIGNEIYGDGLDSMLATLARPLVGDAPTDFIATWCRLWEEATSNRTLFLFIHMNGEAAWLDKDNHRRKRDLVNVQADVFKRLHIDAPSELAAALIGGTMAALVTTNSTIEPVEVASRLWRALSDITETPPAQSE